MTPPTPALFLFDTTHHALWAEEVARDRSIPAEVVPAPPDSTAACDLALECRHADEAALGGALEEEGVPHRLYVRTG